MTGLAREAETPSQTFARLLMRVHDLIAEEQGDSEEADSIRDRMEAPWQAMSREERKRMEGLSADLYTLAKGGVKGAAMGPEARERWAEEAKRSMSALRSGDYDAALAFLRQPAPDNLPSHAYLFLQGRC